MKKAANNNVTGCPKGEEDAENKCVYEKSTFDCTAITEHHESTTRWKMPGNYM